MKLVFSTSVLLISDTNELYEQYTEHIVYARTFWTSFSVLQWKRFWRKMQEIDDDLTSLCASQSHELF